ncbi:conserved hypothetical protein [Ricinus communis]|uniref:Uncharacterized protein n=1 Tax=Ricinus communis TaxID=3988 RepID=B9RRJ8_RICCO|nr:conserved hypothetical protein [Ricinus communis]
MSGRSIALGRRCRTYLNHKCIRYLITTGPTIYCWEGLGFTGTLLFHPPSINA